MNLTLLYQYWAILKRDYLLTSAPRLAFAWQVGSIIFAVPTLYYLGRLIQPTASPYLAPFGGNYFAFVILGVAFATFLAAALNASGAAIFRDQSAGTLEALISMPTSLVTLTVASSLWPILLAGGQAALYLVLAGMVFGLDLGSANLVGAGVIVLLSTSTCITLGILSGAVVLIFRQPDPLLRGFAAASALLAGVFYPTAVLPPLLQQLSQLLPLTYALRGLRLALLQGYGLTALKGEILALLAFQAASVPLTALVLPWAVRYAKRAGTLTSY